MFTVTLSSVADRAVEVNFNTEDDTAEGEDSLEKPAHMHDMGV